MEPRQIQANFEDGVLRVLVPKDEQKTMRHQIQVQGATQGASQPSGQLSDRLGQQATDVPVQDGAADGQSAETQNTPQPAPSIH